MSYIAQFGEIQKGTYITLCDVLCNLSNTRYVAELSYKDTFEGETFRRKTNVCVKVTPIDASVKYDRHLAYSLLV